MINNNNFLKITTIDKLVDYIIDKIDIGLQLIIVGEEYYYSYTTFDSDKRKDIMLSSLKQMPEDIIESIIKLEDWE